MKKIIVTMALFLSILNFGLGVAQAVTFYCSPQQAIKFTHDVTPSSVIGGRSCGLRMIMAIINR